MYACSPRWPPDWLSEEDGELVLTQLSRAMRDNRSYPGGVSLNEGLHFTGGEPFLNFGLLLRLTEMAARSGMPSIFVETNGFWCGEDGEAREKLRLLKDAGMDGIMVSANPFILEQVPFERTERAAHISREVFGSNAMVYQDIFFRVFQALGVREALSFEEFLVEAGSSIQYAEILPNGRLPYKLGMLTELYPASHFFGSSCQRELLRDWHVHVDNYCNLVPGFCGGLSLGDARELDKLCLGIDLDARPVLKALLTDLEDLLRLGKEHGYQEREGYVSKCHLCADVRRHLVERGDYTELKPPAFYARLEDEVGEQP
jgi:hypothetical protein